MIHKVPLKSFFSLGLILICCCLSCKSLPKTDIVPQEPYEDYEDYEDYGDYEDMDYDWSMDEGDEPSLALPPEFPPDSWQAELSEPFFELGEAFLPESPPEEMVIAETLPEPEAPELPVQGPASEQAMEPLPPEIAAEESPPEPEAPEPAPPEPAPPEAPPTPPAPVVPPPPPRIVRPAEIIPPPPPAREVIPLPVNPLPDLPARNPPTLTPAPVPSPPGGVSSRIVRATVGQTIEVPFRGTGWVYLGESASRRGVSYNSRRLDPEGQTFIFRADEAGAYELKFYRQDFIRDYIINDLVTLIVEEAPLTSLSFGAPLDQGRVIAEPRWPTLVGETSPGAGLAPPVAPAAASPGAVPGAAYPAVPPPSPATPPVSVVSPDLSAIPPDAVSGLVDTDSSPILPPDTPSEEYLHRAREEYGADHIPQAIAILNQFMTQFPLGSDEALWLYAQMYEKSGPSRNIRLSLDYYRRLVNEYPQSSRYTDARRRIAYLERYYINIQ